MDFEKILSALPHRYPFLLVDRVVEVVKGQRIHAYKNLLPRMTAYVHVISRVPLEMRIIAALAITTLIALAIVGVMWSGPYSDTFLPNLIGTIFGLAVFAVLLPRVESPPGSKAAANTGQANTQEGAGGRGR